ncbi:PPOX class F420-dependent oxidoreductase [Nocardia jiangxiensis]|uniref:PPOX class F420-dependent oxidoreductase n=1 Tax=Nocardia jiangxiensis TaxID=282685 RepID=A0ABW6RXR0_9NOCA|nr:PPOX class F420-dependent oxidoreductase [Nocardia jiangxiensis]
MTWDELANSKYALLTSYKKDGTAVGAPVWVAPDGDRIVVWTYASSWKVKRIRRNPQVRLQSCDNRGRTTSAEVLNGTAEVLDSSGTERVRGIVGHKYGVIGTILIRAHKLVKGSDGSVGLSVTPRDGAQ